MFSKKISLTLTLLATAFILLAQALRLAAVAPVNADAAAMGQTGAPVGLTATADLNHSDRGAFIKAK